jgi:ferrous iron transport protein B
MNSSINDPKYQDEIVLIGNPNVGKSVIFGILTGKYVDVSNYPGTTIEITRGTGKIQKKQVTFLDTPGTNSFLPNSEDERVTRDILLNQSVSTVLQIGDAKNLKRVLFLSLQLAEMGVPFILNLNMIDELEEHGLFIDYEKLEQILGVKVNSTIAIRRVGTDRLSKILDQPAKAKYHIKYPNVIENAIRGVENLLNEPPVSKRSMAVMLLTSDGSMHNWVNENLTPESISELQKIIFDLEGRLNVPANYAITETRYRNAEKIYDQVVEKKDREHTSFTEKLDHYITHPIWGIPVLLLVLFLVYEFVGVFGAGTLVNFFESVIFGEYINPAAIWLFDKIIPIDIIRDLFVGEYGIITMALSYGFAIVLPIVGTFFIIFSVLEDSGYLPRLSLMVNRFFRILGLNGKAVLPMVLGLGCDTMATMSARILETRKERIIVILLLALGVPCSAQLGVILGMTALLPWQGIVIWFVVVAVVMISVAALSARIIPGEKSDFILELPPIRLPVLSNIIIKTMARIEWYLKEVVPIFIVGTIILFIFDKFQLMSAIESVAAPVVQDLLGLPAKATESFLIGFLRRDYGAAGLFNLANQGLMNKNQMVVSIITITLFMPCIANFLMIIKELGTKMAIKMSLFIVPFAFLVGGAVNYLFKFLGIEL